MPDYDAEAVLAARDDPFAIACLADDGEPDLQRAWNLLPPLVGRTFIGGRPVSAKPVVLPDGTVPGIITAPLRIEPGEMACLGDQFPACLEMVGADRQGRPVRRTIFAREADGRTELWWQDVNQTTQAWVHAAAVSRPVDEWEFRAALQEVLEQQAEEMDESAVLWVPVVFRLAARVSLLRALNGFVGHHPKYGWGGYEHERHDPFPPTIVSLGHALIDLGLLPTAKELVGHWLATFVTADGELDYYGPALSEHGKLLDLAVRLARASRDRDWYEAVRPPLVLLAHRLLRLRGDAMGLLPGLPEADFHQDSAAHQTVYYSNNLWCIRGLAMLGQLMGDETPYEAAAKSWMEDVHRLLAAERVTMADGFPYLPAAAGFHTPPTHLTADRFSSYDNYRMYPEMLSSRVLGRGQAERLFELRERYGGELCGTTRFQDGVDDWPAMDMGLAHLDHDRVAAAQRLLVGHLAICHALGHMTAYEQVSIRPDETGRRYPQAGYCVPAQLVAPRLLRNLLVHEAADSLWLNRAGFRRWLPDGYGVEEVPTRWGKVSYKIAADGPGVIAHVDVAGIQPEVIVRLRLRLLDGGTPTHLEIDGQRQVVTETTVSLPRDRGALTVRAW